MPINRASGTSFAAPIVSATLSLIWSKSPDLSADDVRRHRCAASQRERVRLHEFIKFAGISKACDLSRSFTAEYQSTNLSRSDAVSMGRACSGNFLPMSAVAPREATSHRSNEMQRCAVEETYPEAVSAYAELSFTPAARVDRLGLENRHSTE